MLQNTAIALLTVGLLLGGVLYGYIHLASGMLIHEVSILLGHPERNAAQEDQGTAAEGKEIAGTLQLELMD